MIRNQQGLVDAGSTVTPSPSCRPFGPRPRGRTSAASLLALFFLAAATSPAEGQSVLERTPNIQGAWVGQPSTLYFNFLHRFDASGPPARKVSNSPTFLLGWGFGGYGLVGVHYTTASDLAPGHPNEWEVLGRLSPLSSAAGAPVDFGITAAWNEAAESFDGELSVGVPAGPGQIHGVLRGFSNGFGGEDARWAVGVGGTLDLTEHVALAADFVTPTSLDEGEEIGWGAAVQLAIPHTPHTLSLQAANTNSATLQGSSRRSGGTRFGFEFTVPFTPARYFGDGASGGMASDPSARAGDVDLVAEDTVIIEMRDFEYSDERVVVRPGTYVVWTNVGETVHSATSDSGAWESPLIAPGESYGRMFTHTGEHPYHCMPHPFMTATLVVRAEGEGP